LEKVTERVEEYVIGEDISETMGIKKYEPPIPTSMAGKVKPFEDVHRNSEAGSHDCEHFRTYVSELEEGERIVVTEKVHGSQAIYTMTGDVDNLTITSKGMRGRGLHILEDDTNLYWKAFHNSGLEEVFKAVAEEHKTGAEDIIRMFGEALPCQKGFSYGFTEPGVLLFDIRVNGKSIPYDQVPDVATKLWVPVILDGDFIEEEVLGLCKGKERVSGEENHIREGVVVAPYIDRRAADRTRLRLKVINPKYKETGLEYN
jgi:RNA ligase (TIGR02306 family)